MSVQKESDQRDHHLDQNAIITTLKQENKELKEEVFAKQSVINRLMAKTENNIITSKNKNTEQSRNATPDKKKERIHRDCWRFHAQWVRGKGAVQEPSCEGEKTSWGNLH